MRFRFKIQQYQTDAVESVVRVFDGQPYSAGVSYRRDIGETHSVDIAGPVQLSMVKAAQTSMFDDPDDTGYLNENLLLTDAQLLHNIRQMQQENNIRLSDSLVKSQGRCSLDVEMETGTGKTYVYIKTMFELNKRYGWSKFIVVVPSIAIREGVKKSFEITQDHFMELYGKKARFFIYSSSNLNQLDSFSSDSGINVMIINTQAFAASMNEDKNVEGRKGDAAARIIFSHSALREGWDNPNVFQICTLKHGGDSSTQKRQEVGRGLRLCVNQAGDRMDAETVGDQVHVLNTLTVIASEGYASFVKDLQDQTRQVLYDRPRKASIEYFEGKNVFTVDGKKTQITHAQARQVYQYLVRSNYVDEDDNVTQDYRDDVQSDTLRPLPEALQPMQESIHKLVQAIFDDKVLAEMFKDGNKTPAPENPLNDRFYKDAFQTLWRAINHKYAYTVDFDSEELIQKSIKAINEDLFVSRLQYTVSTGSQREAITGEQMRGNDAFDAAKTRTSILKHSQVSQIRYDLIGKIAEGTVLTRRTVAAILQGIKPEKFAMFAANPEEFISKVIRHIREQKATMIVEHITYDTIEGSYDSSIFTAEKNGRTFDQAFHATKAIQDYVFTDGTAEKSVERRFVEQLDGAVEVNIYAKLPRGFHIPTPVGNYSPDWAIVFHDGMGIKHIYFVAETKGTMETLNLRPIEKAKIDCAKKLFESISTGAVRYDHVDSYEQLMNKVMQ